MKQIIPSTNINFMALNRSAFTFSTFLIVISLLSALFKGFNFGIDFKGGYTFEVQLPKGTKLKDVRNRLDKMNLGDTKVRSFDNDETKLIINIEMQDKLSHEDIVAAVKKGLGKGVKYRKIDLLGAKVTGRMIKNAALAILFALIAMLLYVWIRFEWQFSLGAILTQLHDVILVIGFYSIFNVEFNSTAMIAILTTLGYSINDTVVIYDRIRENLGRFEDKSMTELINLSINGTLTRNILTSGSTLLALFALYWFGGLVLSVFVLPIICGIVVGTFSSIFLAAPILSYIPIDRNSFIHGKKDEDSNDESEIDEVPIK